MKLTMTLTKERGKRSENSTDTKTSENFSLSGRTFLAQKDIHCGCFVLLTFLFHLHMPHAKRARTQATFRFVHCLFHVFTRVLLLFVCFFLHPSIRRNRNFVTAHRLKQKVSNNLDAKCMMKEEYVL